jgi:subtilisin-like proprotein convertase family protein
LNTVLRYSLIVYIVCFSVNISWGQSARNFWINSKGNRTTNTSQKIITKTNNSYQSSLLFDQLTKFLSTKQKDAFELLIPYPSGELGTFRLSSYQLLAADLAKKYPAIKAYKGINIVTGDAIRIDISPNGFHATIYTNDGTICLDPLYQNDINQYQAYYKADVLDQNRFFKEAPITTKQVFGFPLKARKAPQTSTVLNGEQLRIYRIAVSATGEYTTYHGGTKADALAAITTTLNRVNGIYERDLAVRLVLVANTDAVIYTDANADPYTPENTGSFLDQTQSTINSVIGSTNYDIGHCFTAGSNAGAASLGVVCDDSQKARGITGNEDPANDPFNVDYVAHEIGHQFGAPHTFNGSSGSCLSNRNAATAYEPGSGTTIMAYAGICAPQNIAANSGDYFHSSSIEYIEGYIQSLGTSNCASIENTGNTAPTTLVASTSYTLPVSTPFILSGSASDADGDNYTYCWEQFDLGPAGNPDAPVDEAPLFRSFKYKVDSFRIFPRLSDILNNVQTTGEILPDYSRDLNFRLTVRDDQPEGGISYAEVTHTVTETAGPFIVNSIPDILNGYDNVEINWDVANTNNEEVNCQLVNILFSSNGGFSFDSVLVANTPNDGSEFITIPNIATSNARIKVEAVNNIFFNINPTDFNIIEIEEPDFVLQTPLSSGQFCDTETIQIPVSFSATSESISSIDLSVEDVSEGLNYSFSQTTIDTTETAILEITSTGAVGELAISISGTAAGITNTNTLNFRFFGPILPISNFQVPDPSNLRPGFSWSTENTGATYEVAVAADASFSTVLWQNLTLTTNAFSITDLLPPETTYFIRLKAKNTCYEGDYMVKSFTTQAPECVPINTKPLTTIPDTVSTTEVPIPVDYNGFLQEMRITNLDIKHSYIRDLSISLRSPEGTVINLLNSICDAEDNLNMGFDDNSTDEAYTCPPVDSSIYKPNQRFSNFYGENPFGIWTLIVNDTEDRDGGSVDNITLEFCLTETNRPRLDPPTNLTVEYIEDGEILLEWEDNTNQEVRYQVERSVNGENNYKIFSSLDVDTESFNTVMEHEDSLYYYRVQAIGDTLTSEYSSSIPASFDLLTNKTPSNRNVFIYPNPAEDNINIVFPDDLEQEQFIHLYNTNGQTLWSGTVRLPIPKEISISMETAKSGMYFLDIRSSSSRILKKIIKL